MPFKKALVGARRILGGWRWSGWLWCCGRSYWWCSRRMTKRSSPAGSGQGRRGANERRVQSRSTLSEAKPGSLWIYGPVPSPAATPRVCHRPPDYTRGSPHSSAHPGTLWCWLSSRLRRCDVALTWNHTKYHNCSRKLCFHHPCHVPVIRGNPDLHFEGAGNGPVVITWIGRDHELYSGASPISLVEHCATFRHDRRLLLLLGFVHNWPTCRWFATKKENRFSLNGNGIMTSFLGRQFYPSTLYFFHMWSAMQIFRFHHVLLLFDVPLALPLVGNILRVCIVYHSYMEKGNNVPLWDEVKMIDRGIRRLKETARMVDCNDLLSRPSIEMNILCA